MLLLKRLKKALKDKSGASIIFVLGIMMFLMAIGISVMAAGTANSGALMRQNEYSKVLLLSKSIHDNIMYSLQADPENETLLGYQLAFAIFSAFDMDDNVLNPGSDKRLSDIHDMKITLSSGGSEFVLFQPGGISTDIIHVSDVVFKFPVQDVVISPAIEFDPVYVDGAGYQDVPKIPRTATVNARMVVDVVVAARDRHITSRAVYEYKNGRLIGIDNIYGNIDDPEFLMRFEPDGYGIWELVSYEIIDTIN